jgi:hypothetical protein
MRKLRFTIRDVLWLMVVIGLAEGWWLDHRRVELETARCALIMDRYRSAEWELHQREESLKARERDAAGKSKAEESEAVGNLP